MIKKENDLSLISKIKDWDQKAMSILYEKYVDKIYKYFYFRTNNKINSEDLTSDTFFGLFEGINRFDNNKSRKVSSWIYAIAQNKLCDYFKKYWKQELQVENEKESFYYDNSILKDLTNTILVEDVCAFLSTIHPKAKDILLMKIWEGMTHQEIAQELWISLDNSKKIYSRSIKQVNEKFGEIGFSFIILLIEIWKY